MSLGVLQYIYIYKYVILTQEPGTDCTHNPPASGLLVGDTTVTWSLSHRCIDLTLSIINIFLQHWYANHILNFLPISCFIQVIGVTELALYLVKNHTNNDWNQPWGGELEHILLPEKLISFLHFRLCIREETMCQLTRSVQPFPKLIYTV